MKVHLFLVALLLSTTTCKQVKDKPTSFGEKLLQQGKYREAIKELKFAMLNNSVEHNLPFLLGEAYLQEENYDSALVFFQKSKELGRNDAELFYKLGVTKYELDKLDCSDFLVALSLDDQRQEIWYYSGLCLMEVANFKKAFEFFSRSISLDMAHHQSYQQRSLSSYAVSNYSLALDDINKAISLNDSLDYFYQKASILNRMEAFEEVLLACDKALEIDASNIRTLRLKAQTMINMGMRERGCALIKKIMSINPEQDLSSYSEICL